MVVTLEARGYLLATGDRYVLSLLLFQLAHRHQPVRSLVPTALPLMTRLAKQTGQSRQPGGNYVATAWQISRSQTANRPSGKFCRTASPTGKSGLCDHYTILKMRAPHPVQRQIGHYRFSGRD